MRWSPYAQNEMTSVVNRDLSVKHTTRPPGFDRSCGPSWTATISDTAGLVCSNFHNWQCALLITDNKQHCGVMPTDQTCWRQSSPLQLQLLVMITWSRGNESNREFNGYCRHQQDKTVLSCQSPRCELNWWRVKTATENFKTVLSKSQNAVWTGCCLILSRFPIGN